MKSWTVLPLTAGGAQRGDLPRFVGFLLQLALFDSLVMVGEHSDDNSLARQLLWGGLGLAAAVHILGALSSERERRFGFGGWTVGLLLAYALASTAWSVTPASTLKRAVVLVFLVAVCGISAGAWNRDWRKDMFSVLLAPPMALLAGLAVLLTLAAPDRAFSEIGWRGVSSQKNEAGQMMAFAMLLLAYGVCHDRLGKPLRALLLAAATAFLLLSKSTTGMLALVFGVILTEAVTLPSTLRRRAAWQPAILATLLAASLALFFAWQLDLLPGFDTLYASLLGALGKSDTFTGRTAIWQLVLGESRFHDTLIGGGYGGFWVGRNSISGYVTVGDELYPGQAHNGYIDIYNDLGILGLALLALMLVLALVRAGRLLAAGHPEGKLHLAIVLMCLFLNLGESTFLRGTQFMNIVFLASFVRMAAVLRQRGLDTGGPPC
jgi:exopolysaccharide production protein ExoQ